MIEEDMRLRCIQQNKERLQALREKHGGIFNGITYSQTQHPQLSTRYNGYLQISRKKQPVHTAYYTSSFLNDLKEKRNTMFSDEIIDKLQKSYNLKEYASTLSWKIIQGGQQHHHHKSKFQTTTTQIENYEQIEKRMTAGR